MMRGRFVYDPVNPDRLFVAYMRSASGSDEATVSANRRVGFASSTDGGTTWSLVEELEPGFRLGYPSIAVLSDGTPLVACHGDPDGQGVRTMTYAGSDAGFFRTSMYQRLSVSGRSGEDGAGVIWPTWVVDPADENRTVLVASLSNLEGTGAAPLHVAAAAVGESAPWRVLADSSLASSSGGRNPMAVSPGGKIGVAYFKNGPLTDAGIYFSESSDGGETWSEPTKCLGYDYADETYGPTDTISIGSNVDLAYLGEDPIVTTVASRAGLYATQCIMLWTPSGGARPIVSADSTIALGLQTAAPARLQPNMQYVSYPSISIGDNGRHVVAAFQAAAQAGSESPQVTSPEGFYYFRLWCVGSNDGGQTWGEPLLLQDFAGTTGDSASLEYPAALSSCQVQGDRFVHRMVFQGRRFPGMYAFVVEDVSSDIGDQPAERGPFSETHLYFQETLLDTAVLRSIPASTPPRTEGVASLAISPNPALEHAQLGLRLEGTGVLTVRVIDPLGRELSRSNDNTTRHAGYHSIPLELTGVPAGSYRVVATHCGTTRTIPLTVVR